jgi:hypothetical protein
MNQDELHRWYQDLIPAGRLKVVRYTPRISSRQIVDRIVNRARDRTPRTTTEPS